MIVTVEVCDVCLAEDRQGQMASMPQAHEAVVAITVFDMRNANTAEASPQICHLCRRHAEEILNWWGRRPAFSTPQPGGALGSPPCQIALMELLVQRDVQLKP